jgi:hypothetical protein
MLTSVRGSLLNVRLRRAGRGSHAGIECCGHRLLFAKVNAMLLTGR